MLKKSTIIMVGFYEYGILFFDIVLAKWLVKKKKPKTKGREGGGRKLWIPKIFRKFWGKYRKAHCTPVEFHRQETHESSKRGNGIFIIFSFSATNNNCRNCGS